MHQKDTDFDCQQCRGLLFDYVSELTGEGQNQQIEAHLAHCPSCKQEYNEICEMLAVLQHAPQPELPAGFQLSLHQKLVQAAEELEQKKAHSWLSRIKSFNGWRVLSPALVCLALVIGVFSSGLYDEWRDADEVLTGEVATSTATPEPTRAADPAVTEPVPDSTAAATATAMPAAEKTADPAPKTETQAPVREEASPAVQDTPVVVHTPVAESTPAPETAPAVPAVPEKGLEAERATEDAGLAVAHETDTAAYAGRASGGGGGGGGGSSAATVTEDTAEAMSVMPETAEAEEATAVAETAKAVPATYRVELPTAADAYLEACEAATGIRWSGKASALTGTYARLTLSAEEWETLSRYIISTGIQPRLVTEGTTAGEVTVIMQGYE